MAISAFYWDFAPATFSLQEATMLRLGRRRREILIEKSPDVANAFLISTLIGQFFSDRPYSIALAIIGTAISLALWAFALALARDEQP